MKNDQALRLLAEQYQQVQVNEILIEGFNRDLEAFEAYLIKEGLWDTIKQKGAALASGAKSALVQPLIKAIMNKIAQSDPEGFKKIQAAAASGESGIQQLLNSPEVKQQQQQISQDVAATTESIDDGLYSEVFEEAIGYLIEARVLSNDPRNVRRRELAAQKRAASQQPASNKAAPGKQPPVLKPSAKPAAPATPSAKPTTPTTAQPPAAQGGFIQKAYAWMKQHPKLTAAGGLALMAALGVATLGAGGIVPLIASVAHGAAAGAAGAGVVGGALKGGANVVGQMSKGGKVDWKQAGKAALQGAKAGAKAGAVAGGVGAALGGLIAGGVKIAHGLQSVLQGGSGTVSLNDLHQATQSAQQVGTHKSALSQEVDQINADCDAKANAMQSLGLKSATIYGDGNGAFHIQGNDGMVHNFNAQGVEIGKSAASAAQSAATSAPNAAGKLDTGF